MLPHVTLVMTRSLASKWAQFASNKLLDSIPWDQFSGNIPWLNGRSNGTDMYYGTLLAAYGATHFFTFYALKLIFLKCRMA